MVYAKSMYNIQHTVMPENGKLRVKLECERTDVKYAIRSMEENLICVLLYIRSR